MGTPKGTKPWNAGTSKGWTDKRGYRWLYVTENGRRRARREHRVIVERAIGRRLDPWECVHHKNGDTMDNRVENLEVKDWSEHTVEHHTGAKRSDTAKARMQVSSRMREEIIHLRLVNADLLEALRGVALTLDDLHYKGGNYSEMPPEIAAVYDLASAAIAKAEGGSE